MMTYTSENSREPTTTTTDNTKYQKTNKKKPPTLDNRKNNNNNKTNKNKDTVHYDENGGTIERVFCACGAKNCRKYLF